MTYRSASFPFGFILHHDTIQVLPSIKHLLTRIDETMDVISQGDERFKAPFDCPKNNLSIFPN